MDKSSPKSPIEIPMDEFDLKDGSYISRKPIDSGISGCRWHLLEFDACIPSSSIVLANFQSSDDEKTWLQWPDDDASRTLWQETGRSAEIITGRKHVILIDQRGRFINLKLSLKKGDWSKIDFKVRLYFPRTSLLDYLPAVYQEDRASKEFLERFLGIFEQEIYRSEEAISRISTCFDPMEAPEEFLPWLAGWLSLDLYELLGDLNRDYILNAFEFYRKKGTVSGLVSLVSFLTGVKCCAKEYVNHVFRSYGMEHEEAERYVDELGCSRSFHAQSLTVDTSKLDLLSKRGTFLDRIHYTLDTGPEGIYHPKVVGLFLFVPGNMKPRVDERELPKIIKSFLPVFVRVKIFIVQEFAESYSIGKIIDDYRDNLCIRTQEKFDAAKGHYVYTDATDWNLLFSYENGKHEDGLTNHLSYRTVHCKLNTPINTLAVSDSL